jgi:hypothetical protein
MDDRIRELIEKDAIVGTINRLFVATDSRDWEAVKACFAPRVLFDMTSMTGGEPVERTPQEIADAWAEGLRPLAAIHHQAGNHAVTIRGERADAFCYGIASHYLPNPSGRNTRVFVGSYDFSLERTSGAWRIRGFRFNLKYVDGNARLEAEGSA